MKKLLKRICRLLEGGEDLVLATIISRSGSTPRTVGTKMVVRSGGSIEGTIGGGMLEAMVIKAATALFESRGAAIHTFNLTQDGKAGMDMICGGELDVLIEFVAAMPENLAIFQTLQALVEKGCKALLITALGEKLDAISRPDRCLIVAGRVEKGHFTYAPSFLEQIWRKTNRSRDPHLLSLENHHFLIEPCLAAGTVYLFGAGHVSRQLATLTSRVGFRMVVLDDRQEFANAARFPTADEIHVVDSLNDCFGHLTIDRESYVVILTRGHLFDKAVLGQALKTQAGYIGMIGSRSKREAIYNSLQAEGVSPQELKQVHSPIGLSIGAETPAEIAVSIVAELIQHRAQLRS